MKKVKLVLSSVAVMAAIGAAFTSQASKSALALTNVAAERYTNSGAASCKIVGRCDIGNPSSTCFAVPIDGTKPARVTLFTVVSGPTCLVKATGTYTATTL